MRWVLMLFVVLAAVMGGEARAVVVMGRVVVSERDGGAAVEERASEDALRGASRGTVPEVEEVAGGLVDRGPLVLWFPGGLAVARSDCDAGQGGARPIEEVGLDNRVARTETEERRIVNSTSWVRTAVADQRCLYRNAAGTGPNGRNQLSQSWETRTRWHAESGAPLELSEQTVSYRYDPRGNRTRRTTRLWKQARTTGSAAWPVPMVTDTDEALEWDGENRLTGMWRGPWKEELAQVPFESLVGEAVEGSTVWRWGYDHRSRRVQRDEPGSGGERLRTVTVFSGGTSAAEYTVTAAAGSAWTVPSAATVQHVRGPDLGGGTKGLLYSLRNGLPTFNRYNGRGDVVAQSNIDGTTTWAASYQADGRRTAEAGTNVERHRANTKEEDPTGLLNEGFRYRDMETGTFISRDPLGHVDGPNVYCYVRQNPWTHWDPEGLFVGALVKRINEHIITPAAEGLVGAMVDALPQSAVEQLSSSRGFESAVEAGRTVSGGIMHGSQEALGMLSPMDGAADKLLKGDLSGAVKEAAIEAGGGRVFKAAGKGIAAVKRHAGKLDEAVGALSHADDAATATATGVRESIEEASSVLAKEGGGAAKTGAGWKPTPFNQCFPAGTMILMADGTCKPIESIAEGEEVLADDPEDSSPPSPKRVTHLHRNWTQRFIHVAVDTDNDGTGDSEICATGEHPFWTTSRGWVAAKDLSFGDPLRTPWGDTPRVVSATSMPAVSNTYNLTVQGAHTFFALVGQTPILVHNTEPFDIAPFGSFDRPRNLSNGVPFQRHELLQNGWLKVSISATPSGEERLAQ